MKSFLPKFGSGNDDVEQVVNHSSDDMSKDARARTEDVPSESDSDEISADAQAGVQKIEAITKVWSNTHLIVAYVM